MSNDYPPPHPGQDPEGQSNQPPPSEPQWNPQSSGTTPPSAAGEPGYGQPAYGQPAYGQPAYGGPPGYPPGGPGGYGQAPKTSPLAIVSLVLGIVAVPCCTFFAFGIGALVTGLIARKQIGQAGGALKGGGMATAGVILGAITIVLAIVVWILNLSGVISGNYNFETN